MTGSEKKGVLIAEDHTLIREGLRSLLSSHPDLEVIGEAGDGREAIQRVGEALPRPGVDGFIHAADGRGRGHPGN